MKVLTYADDEAILKYFRTFPDLKKHRADCGKELQVPDEVLNANTLVAPQYCFQLCLYQRIGLLGKDGKVLIDDFSKVLKRSNGEFMIDKLVKCSEISKPTDCETAYEIMDCLRK